MDRGHPGVDPAPRDQREPPRPYEPGVTSERLRPPPAELALPAALLGATLLGIAFVLLILVIWLRAHFTSRHERKQNSASPDMSEDKFKDIINNSQVQEKEDHFTFRLPHILNDTDLKYIDEFEGGRNDSPPILKMKKNGGSSPKIPGNIEDEGKSSGNSTPSSAAKKTDSKFVFPPEEGAGTSGSKTWKSGEGGSRFKVALPEQQWISYPKPPLDWRGYNINIPKAFGLSEGAKADSAPDISGKATSSKKYSATRSPSLEKDDKSPFYSARCESPPEFVFGNEAQDQILERSELKSGDSSPIVEVRVQPAATDSHRTVFDQNESSDSQTRKPKTCKSPEFKTERGPQEKDKPRRFGGSNTGLRINMISENINQNVSTEKSEVQYSPRLMDSTIGKENTLSPRFSFSPKFFATPDSKSPKFFGTPDQRSPKFFGTPDQRSPNFFAENQSRNASPKPSSPRLSSTASFKSIQSPLILDNTNGDYFIFEKTEDSLQNDNNKANNALDEVDNVFVSKITNFDGDDNMDLSNEKTDLEKLLPECVTNDSLALNDVYEDRLLNNVNSSDVTGSGLSSTLPRRERMILSRENFMRHDDGVEENDNKTDSPDLADDLACDDIMNPEQPHNETEHVQSRILLSTGEDSQDSLAIPFSGTTANYRRQRLKSISLDSDNAKFIEQNLGIPIVKHLRQENLYDMHHEDEKPSISSSFDTDENTEYRDATPPRVTHKDTYFKFGDDENELYVKFENGNNTPENVQAVVQTDIRASPDIVSPIKFLRDNSSAIAFSEMQPRFSPKEFDAFSDDKNLKASKNIRNLTIDLNKKDVDLVKDLLEYDCLDSATEKRMTPKTPTLKVKATSLDSSETLNLSLPQQNTLQVPQNSISVPNTPKRQLKRALSQKSGKLVKGHYSGSNCNSNLNEIVRVCPETQQRKIFMNVKCPANYIDSGIFLRENHANLMLFQASKYTLSRGINSSCSNFSRRMGSFDENMVDLSETGAQILTGREFTENRLSLPQKMSDGNLLGSNLLSFKQNLSVSSTNLKTLPEGVPSNDFETQPDEKASKRTLLQRRGSNQSLTINLETAVPTSKYSTLSLQGSNLSLASFGASSHNLTNIKNSASNFSLNTDNRQKKNILERRNSNTSLTLNLDCSSQHGRVYTGSNCNLQSSHYNLANQDAQNVGQSKKCLLQRRGSNTSLTLNLQALSSCNLNRCTSNSSLNIHNESKVGQKKGLLERRSSNTSLTLNINGSNPQFDSNRVLSVSNYNLDGGCGLSRYNSNQSINNTGEHHKKGLLERRSSNTSLTLNINSSNYNLQSSSSEVQVPRDIEIDDTVIQCNLNTYDCYKEGDGHGVQQREKHRKSLSTENLFPKSYKSRTIHCKNMDNVYSFGSHDNLWSNSYANDSLESMDVVGGQNLTYICGDQENEMIYAFGDRQHIENAGFQASVPIRNITTKPLSPHSTSEDFKMYLANIQHLQNASNVLTRQQLKDLNSVFQDGYSKTECPSSSKRSPTDILANQVMHLTLEKGFNDDILNEGEYNPQRLLPEPVLPCPEYQKSLLRNLHQEFWDLPTNFQEKPMVFGSHPKNRYKTILPNEHSRVILRAEVGETDEGYINANYIKGHEYSRNCYIATQGPLQNTVYDFWLMVYQNGCQFHKEGCTKTNEDRHFGSPQGRNKKVADGNDKSADRQTGIQKIVMLTNFVENGRQKCEKYFPLELCEEMMFKQLPNPSYSSACSGGHFFSDNGNIADNSKSEDIIDANYFRIKNVGVLNNTGYTVRKLLVEYSNKFLMKSSTTPHREEVGNTQSAKTSKSDLDGCTIVVDVPREAQQADDIPKTNLEDESHTDSLIVYHYWFDNWADHKCPKDVTALLDLSLDVLQNCHHDFETENVKQQSVLQRTDRLSVKAKSFDRPDNSSNAARVDKSMTYFDFSSFSREKDESKASNIDIDSENVPRERRLSAFQLAKAFFDEAARANCPEDNFKTGRKNSLASRLDLPKRHDLVVRRESTGKIDSSKQPTKLAPELGEEFKIKEEHKNTSGASKANLNILESSKEMPPIIVHCSAGIGRTGCLIAILNGIRQLKMDQRVDILGIVCNMRFNRGGMVQNSEQYELIHKVLCLYEDIGLPDAN